MLQPTFNYLHDVRTCVRCNNDIELVVERVNNDVARIYLRNKAKEQIPLATLNVVVTDMTGNAVEFYLENIMIVWVDSYRVYVNNHEVFMLQNQKQHAIIATDQNSVFFSEPIQQ